jgi:peptidyl-prolyl cis-trans isomerase C
MKRAAAFWISVAVSCVGGICCAELAARSIVLRDKLGTICARGHLLALVRGRGIYQTDLDRTLAEARYVSGTEAVEETKIERQSALTDLITNIAVQSRASWEKIPQTEMKHQFNLLRSQFRDDKAWKLALNASDLSESSLWRMLRNDLRSRQWISKRIAHSELDVAEDERRRFYDSHLENFFVPEQHRVSHLFLAAPPETAPEIVEGKRTAIGALSVRLAAGEDFATLAAQNSEDEATKLRGGDLGYFSSSRMPPDFVAVAVQMRPGEISPPIRTRLGLHILKLIDVQPARQKTFDEARNDIALELAIQHRAAAVHKWIVDLSSEADYLRPL